MARRAPNRKVQTLGFGVDAHCHIFNACDLPVTQFVRQVLLVRHPFLGDLLEPAIAFFAFIMDYNAPTAGDEITKLNEIGSRGLTPASFLAQRKRQKKNREQETVTAALRRLYQGDLASTPRRTGLGVDLPIAGRRALIVKFYRQAFSREPPAITAIDLENLAEQLLLGGEDLAGLVPWFLKFTQFRFEMLDQLAHFSPPADSEIGFYVPATVDYAYWLGEFDTTPIDQQAEVIYRISMLKGLSYRMQGYIAFDPGRQALLEDPSELDEVVSGAVKRQRFAESNCIRPWDSDQSRTRTSTIHVSRHFCPAY